MSGTTITRVGAVSVFVSDLERALEFYAGTLGLVLKARDDDRGCARLELPGAALVLETIDMGDPEERAMIGRHTGIALAVPELGAACSELIARGVPFAGRPAPQRTGERGAPFEDPDGNVLVLVAG